MKHPLRRFSRLNPFRNGLRSGGLVGVALAVSFLATGCVSPSFRRVWREAKPAEGSVEIGGVAQSENGLRRSPERWEGRWESYVNGHQGSLRAVLWTESQGRVRASFEAGWKWFVSAFDVSLEASRRRKRVWLQGEHDLKSCVGGGLYSYRGTVEGDVLWTEYRSARDHGFFELRRVVPCYPGEPSGKSIPHR